MFKSLGTFATLGLGLLLLVYSGTRSLDFIMKTLPPDRQILAWFGLAALDGGLIAWLLCYLYGSRGGWQRAIALAMMIGDFLGCVAMFTVDTLYNTGEAGMTQAMSPDDVFTSVLLLSLVIALNIAGTVAHHVFDPENMKAQAEEEARGKIEAAVRKQISESADVVASEIAPIVAENWRANERSKYYSETGSVLIGGAPPPLARK